MRRALWVGGILVGVLSAGAPSAAKNLCGSLGGTRFYVLEKVKTKPGAHGPVSGYFVTPTGFSAPFSGTFGIFGPGFVWASVSEGVTRQGFGYSTSLHNFSAPLTSALTGEDYATYVDGNSGTVSQAPTATTTWVDCKTVPGFLDPL